MAEPLSVVIEFGYVCASYSLHSNTHDDFTKGRVIKNIPSNGRYGVIKVSGLIMGGAELLFGNEKKHNVQLDRAENSKWTIRKLLVWIEKNLLKERKELFIQGDSVRPGILVLVNDADWELMGELDYELQDNDNLMFISTLHGG